jgi:hypothetical protein
MSGTLPPLFPPVQFVQACEMDANGVGRIPSPSWFAFAKDSVGSLFNIQLGGDWRKYNLAEVCVLAYGAHPEVKYDCCVYRFSALLHKMYITDHI